MKEGLLEARPVSTEIRITGSRLVAIILGSMLVGGSINGLMAGSPSADPRPIASGELQSPLTIWKNPLGSSSNEGNTMKGGSRVLIFEHEVVIMNPTGGRTVAPIGHVGPIHLYP